jgi:hypothetical protein
MSPNLLIYPLASTIPKAYAFRSIKLVLGTNERTDLSGLRAYRISPNLPTYPLASTIPRAYAFISIKSVLETKERTDLNG